jgi:hypothetical protein
VLAAAGEWQLVDGVRKLDTSNRQQMELMHRHFSHNMAAVDFWLNSRVLPQETQQYPQRLVASAWHLADNPSGCVVGFSGTNDNHRLLPLQVKQHLEVETTLRATNGKMLAVMLANREYGTLAPQVRLVRIRYRYMYRIARWGGREWMGKNGSNESCCGLQVFGTHCFGC